ncbi:sigma-54-dependent transcriptional regulator [Desulfosarcina cetonica]|uniref:sigma-54-dependent transcriptional regulator n=1 Tax=Desulfosarcina cetonica TaxID=90730 RepID=UPI00278BEB84|nr:response regulator [Desulfosarcina cetonica]
MNAKILVVDDDQSHRTMLRAVLTAEGYQVQEADDGDTACRAVEQEVFDLVLMDLRMKRMDGDAAQKRMAAVSPETPVIIMTAYGSVRSAVESLKSGARDYLTKPIDVDELKILVAKTLDHHRLAEENRNLKERLVPVSTFPAFWAAARPWVSCSKPSVWWPPPRPRC